MTVGMYWMYDLDAKQSGPIFEATNDAIAIRKAQQLNKDNPYADRTELWYLGTSDHDNAVIETEPMRKIHWLEPDPEIREVKIG